MNINRKRVLYVVETPADGVRRYPADDYRVEIEHGTAIVYLRQVETVSRGDNDIALYMYGCGQWNRIETIIEPPV